MSRRELRRVLGAGDAAWIVAGNMIGAGIFYTPGQVVAALPGVAAPMLAWAAGAVLALCGAAVYAELGSRLPRAGGDYRFLATAFGPVWGFATGWAALLVTFSAAAAAMANVAVHYLASVLPFLGGWGGRVTAPLVILALTVANVRGARFAGRATVWLTAVPLAGLFVLFAVGLLRGSAGLGAADPVPVPLAPPASAAGVAAIGAAMLPIYFTFSGWNAAAYLAGEVRDPQRNLARGLLVGTALVGVVYLAINAVLIHVVPPERLAGSTTAGAQAARILLGAQAERALSVAIALSVLGSAHVTLMAGARVYFAMARDRLAPERLGRVNAAGVPAGALWLSGIWTAILATIGRVDELVTWATLAILLLSSLAVSALFVLRRRDPEVPAWSCPGYPWTPLVYLVASLAVAVSSAIAAPLQAAYGLAIVGSAFPVYALLRTRFGKV